MCLVSLGGKANERINVFIENNHILNESIVLFRCQGGGQVTRMKNTCAQV